MYYLTYLFRFTLSSLIPKESYNGNYYYYTDSCNDVTFIVFEDTLSISADQLNTLRLVFITLPIQITFYLFAKGL